MTLLIRHLTYHINQRALIEDISLSFHPGVLYAIVGPNGAGKSTLLKTMARIWNPTKGELSWQGEDLLQFPRRNMSQTLSLVPQHPQLYFDCNVYHMVEMGRYSHGCSSPEIDNQIEKALRHVNAWHLRHQCISQLSGGERQRVYIARALATQAPIVLLDEPTSHLDVRHQLDIWHLLRHLAREGKVIIVVVHDLLAAQRFCDQLVVLHQGRCQAMGAYAEVMTPRLLRDVFGINASELYSGSNPGKENAGSCTFSSCLATPFCPK